MGRPRPRRRDDAEEREELDERVVHIARTAKVMKGGRRFAFRVVVVVGDRQGSVGMGVGKAREVPEAIRKGIDRARRSMCRIPLVGSTIPHAVLSEYSAAKVLIKPASPGTGVIAGGGARAVLEAAGVKDVLTKSLGSANVLNVVQATIKALNSLKDVDSESERRARPVEDLMPFWERGSRNGESE